ncbi:beta-lactamase domain protein [Desulfosarcina variabilis str. Montpellier]|uniref:MBL fold metallo-hydrolase n=1 Tax=Desulfosarcina variabilis TaxID=2300 RepID=UPI003AFA231A
MTLTTDLEKLPFVQPVSPIIYLVGGPGEGRFPHCNSFLLRGDRTILIDAGIGVQRIEAIDRALRIDTLVVSHPHPDHILAWHALSDRELLLPAQTPDSVFDLNQLGRRFVEGPEDAAYWTHMVKKWLDLHPMRPPDRRFADGETIDFGPIQLQAIHAPGHLIDHYCFMETGSRTLFSIDIDFTGFGPWYGNPESDLCLFRQSVAMLQTLAFERICTSHKAPIEAADAGQAFCDYLAAFDRHQQLILALCRKGMDLAAMLRESPFYRNRMSDATFQRIFETQMIRKNIELLITGGWVVEKKGQYLALDCPPTVA